MPLLQSWHCSGSLITTVLTEDCYATGYQNATITSSTSTPLFTQDAGNLTFGLGWVVFFQALLFLGLVLNTLTPKRV